MIFFQKCEYSKIFLNVQKQEPPKLFSSLLDNCQKIHEKSMYIDEKLNSWMKRIKIIDGNHHPSPLRLESKHTHDKSGSYQKKSKNY